MSAALMVGAILLFAVAALSTVMYVMEFFNKGIGSTGFLISIFVFAGGGVLLLAVKSMVDKNSKTK